MKKKLKTKNSNLKSLIHSTSSGFRVYRKINTKICKFKYWKLNIGSIGNSCLKQDGFTIIEVLIVISIIGIIGSMLVVIFVNSLRGSNKSNTDALLRQNGNYVMSQIANKVRYAKEVSTPVCYSQNPIGENILTITSFDDKTITYTCPESEFDSLRINEGSGEFPFFDYTNITVDSCSFTCVSQNSVTPPVIGIKFSLKRAGTNLSESSAISSFSTSVSLRNFGQ